MIDTVFGIKVRLSGLSINRYRPIMGRLLDAAIALSVHLYFSAYVCPNSQWNCRVFLCVRVCSVNSIRRNHNVRDILKGISLGPKNPNFCDASNNFHHIFFFGDLNYRIDDLDSVVHKLFCLLEDYN